MASGQFRVQELNPFMEWHLQTTATSLEVASEEAKRIARMIGRRTRVLNEDGTVLTEVNQRKCNVMDNREDAEEAAKVRNPHAKVIARNPVCR